MSQRLIVGISGASGAIYGVRLLELLKGSGVETHLIMSQTARITLATETEYSVKQVEALADVVHAHGDLADACSSGSFRTLGMVVAPCSVKTLAEIATGVTPNLLSRSADVVLKERRRLVLMVRETPFNLAHLRNMTAVTEMGGIVFPPFPAFYNKPASIDDLVNDTVERVLALCGFDQAAPKAWAGLR